jgi:competence protein ComEA
MLLALAPAPSVKAADDLPEGAGKDVVLKVCTACHGVSEFTARRNTRAEWDEEVDKMAARGAKASDEEFEAIVNYLAKNFGKDAPPAGEKTN